MSELSSEKTAQEQEQQPELKQQPSIETSRLVLRPFVEQDEERTYRLINDPVIAANTRTIPYPYPRELAMEWIRKHPGNWIEGTGAVFAMCLKDGLSLDSNAVYSQDRIDGASARDPLLVGAIGLQISVSDQNAELGYWLGEEYRGHGVTTEAAAAILDFGFETLALHKIYASFLTRNPASGQILKKIGMEQEGFFRSHVRKKGVFEDVIYCGKINPSKESAG